MNILINGTTCEIARTGKIIHGLEYFWSLGFDLSGRKCCVACHSIPPHILDSGGKLYTDGNTYQVKSA